MTYVILIWSPDGERLYPVFENDAHGMAAMCQYPSWEAAAAWVEKSRSAYAFRFVILEAA